MSLKSFSQYINVFNLLELPGILSLHAFFLLKANPLVFEFFFFFFCESRFLLDCSIKRSSLIIMTMLWTRPCSFKSHERSQRCGCLIMRHGSRFSKGSGLREDGDVLLRTKCFYWEGAENNMKIKGLPKAEKLVSSSREKLKAREFAEKDLGSWEVLGEEDAVSVLKRGGLWSTLSQVSKVR